MKWYLFVWPCLKAEKQVGGKVLLYLALDPNRAHVWALLQGPGHFCACLGSYMKHVRISTKYRHCLGGSRWQRSTASSLGHLAKLRHNPAATAHTLLQTPREDMHLFLLLSPDVLGTAANIFSDAQQTVLKDFNILPPAALRPQCLGIWIDWTVSTA